MRTKKSPYICIKQNKETMSKVSNIQKQANANIDYLVSPEGWNECKAIFTEVAKDMSYTVREEFFQLMRDEEEKTKFLTYLFATTALEAAIIQTK